MSTSLTYKFKFFSCHTNDVLKSREVVKISLLSSDPNLLNVPRRITGVLNDSWIILVEVNKIPCHTWFVSERDHIFCLVTFQSCSSWPVAPWFICLHFHLIRARLYTRIRLRLWRSQSKMAATSDEISEWPHWINISVTILQSNIHEKSADLFALTLQNQGL